MLEVWPGLNHTSCRSAFRRDRFPILVNTPGRG